MTEAYIAGGQRSPIGSFGGSLASVRADDLAAHALKALLQKFPELDPAALNDVIMGCANQAGETMKCGQNESCWQGIPIRSQ